MSRTHIPKTLRERVAAQARYRCGYCLTTEEIVGTPMDCEHIIPEMLGGPTVETNLWLACSLCNLYKGTRISAIDPLTDQVVSLFDPRRQPWLEHFAWAPEGDQIIGLTPTGRATLIALQLNRLPLVRDRRIWVKAGWHPPKD